MKLYYVALKNLLRQKVRTILTIGGVAIAIAVLISLIGFNRGYRDSMKQDIDKLGYEVLVTAKGCPYEAATLILQGGANEIPYINEESTDVYNKIKNDPEVDSITRLFLSAMPKDDSQGFLLMMGIDNDFQKLKPWMKVEHGRYFSGDDVQEVILGYEAAELLTRKAGDELYLGGRVNKVFKVAGIFQRSGTQEDGTIFMPLRTAQKVFKQEGKLTGVGIKLKNIQNYREFVERIDVEVPSVQVITLKQVESTIVGLVRTAELLVGAVALIAIIVALIGVINTILMAVFERTQEIGIMKAIGASNFHIFRLIWFETVIICFFGGILGTLIALIGSNAVAEFMKSILSFAPSGELVKITFDLIVYSIVGAVLLGIFSGIYPALRASTMDPVKAIWKK